MTSYTTIHISIYTAILLQRPVPLRAVMALPADMQDVFVMPDLLNKSTKRRTVSGLNNIISKLDLYIHKILVLTI